MRTEKKSKFRAAFLAALTIYRKQVLLTLFLGVAFFYGGLVYVSTHPKLPSSQSPLLFYSTQSRDDLKLLFVRALEKAQTSIFLIMYGLTDPDLIALLEKKAQNGVQVDVFYDPTGSDPLNERNFRAHPIHSDGLMHKKILVIDNKWVFLGSANMTPQSLKMHDNLVIGLEHLEMADYIQNSLEPFFTFSIKNQKAEFWQLPEQDRKALQRILGLIAQAKKTIHIAMFTFTHPEITEALIEAHKRGVQVKIAIDHYSGRGASKKTALAFQKAGIPIYLSQGGGKLLHHKWCLIDDQIFILGSANWTKSAFIKNDDCLLILEDLSNPQANSIHFLWDSLELSDFKH